MLDFSFFCCIYHYFLKMNIFWNSIQVNLLPPQLGWAKAKAVSSYSDSDGMSSIPASPYTQNLLCCSAKSSLMRLVCVQNWSWPADILTNQAVLDPKVHCHTMRVQLYSRLDPLGLSPHDLQQRLLLSQPSWVSAQIVLLQGRVAGYPVAFHCLHAGFCLTGGSVEWRLVS